MRFVYLTCVLLSWSAAVSQAQVKDSRLPVPDDAAQTKSKETVRQIYKDQFTKATKNEQKLDLATSMLADALATVDAPADRYTLLRIARDMASQIGSVEISQQATDAIIKDFAVVDKEVRLETLEKLAAAPGVTTYKKICDYAALLSDDFVDANDYDAAIRASTAAVKAAKSSKDITLIKTASDRLESETELAQAYAAVQVAKATLQSKPTDPAANLALGRFYCFGKHDWSSGVPMLALGADEELAKIGKEELSAQKPEERIALADKWYDLAAKSEGRARTALRRHAYDLYHANRQGLSGLTAKKISVRIEELEKELLVTQIEQPSVEAATKDYEKDVEAARRIYEEAVGQAGKKLLAAYDVSIREAMRREGASAADKLKEEKKKVIEATAKGGQGPAGPVDQRIVDQLTGNTWYWHWEQMNKDIPMRFAANGTMLDKDGRPTKDKWVLARKWVVMINDHQFIPLSEILFRGFHNGNGRQVGMSADPKK